MDPMDGWFYRFKLILKNEPLTKTLFKWQKKHWFKKYF